MRPGSLQRCEVARSLAWIGGSTALNPIASLAGRTTPVSAEPADAAGGRPPSDNSNLFDPHALAKLAELDPTGSGRLTERVFATFVRTTERLRPALDAGWRDGDLAAVGHVAHTLKSSAAYIGAMRLVAASEAVDTAIRQALGPIDTPGRTAHATRLPPLVAEFNRALDEALAAIGALSGEVP